MNNRQLKLRLLNASLLGVLASILALVITPHTPIHQSSSGDSTLTTVTWKVFHLISSFPFAVLYFACLVLLVAFRCRRKDTWPAAFLAGLILFRIILHLVYPSWP
jgi:cytochrome bd-type quinol oxidase subunit 2